MASVLIPNPGILGLHRESAQAEALDRGEDVVSAEGGRDGDVEGIARMGRYAETMG